MLPDLAQDVDAGHVRQVQVEQDQIGIAVRLRGRGQQVVEPGTARGETLDAVVHTGAPDILFDQQGMAIVILDPDNGYGLLFTHISLLFSVPAPSASPTKTSEARRGGKEG